MLTQKLTRPHEQRASLRPSWLPAAWLAYGLPAGLWPARASMGRDRHQDGQCKNIMHPLYAMHVVHSLQGYKNLTIICERLSLVLITWQALRNMCLALWMYRHMANDSIIHRAFRHIEKCFPTNILSQKNGNAAINMTQHFTNSQHLLIIFGEERLYSILNSRS